MKIMNMKIPIKMLLRKDKPNYDTTIHSQTDNQMEGKNEISIQSLTSYASYDLRKVFCNVLEFQEIRPLK